MNRQEYFFESLIEKFKKHSYTIFCFMKDLINKTFFCCKKVRAAGPLSLFSHSWELIRCKWDWQSSGQRNKLTSMLTLGWTLARPIHFCSQSTGSSKDWDYNKAGEKINVLFLIPYCWFCKESVFCGRRTFSPLSNVTLEMWDAQSLIWKDYNEVDVEQLLQVQRAVQERNIITHVRLSWNRYIRESSVFTQLWITAFFF